MNKVNLGLLSSLIALCKTNHSSIDIDTIVCNLESKEFNYDMFLALCFKNKVAGLVYHSIIVNALQKNVPCRIYYTLRYFYLCNKKRNEIHFFELDRLINAFRSEGVDVRPLKGSILIPTIYTDLGSRMMNDIDLFIRKQDVRVVSDIMSNYGYKQGHYDKTKNIINPLDKAESTIWKLKMYNLPPFHKLMNDGLVDIVSADFTFGLSFSHSHDVSNAMISNSDEYGKYISLSYLDLFIHICCHLYKEATNVAWSEFKQDINLIKFCDVREFYYKFLINKELSEILERVCELEVTDAIYFAIKNTASLYTDDTLNKLALAIPNVKDNVFDNIYNQDSTIVMKRKDSIAKSIVTL